jgi:DUF1680 family protein
VEQSTSFPGSETTTLTVHTKRPATFPLHVRVPAWTTPGFTAQVNSRRVPVDARLGTFLTVERRWTEGDTLRVTFPMALRFEAIAPETPNRQALLCGPLLLVALTDKPVVLQGPKPDVDVVPRSNGLPAFRSGDLTFVPFYKVKEERYTTYVTMQGEAR